MMTGYIHRGELLRNMRPGQHFRAAFSTFLIRERGNPTDAAWEMDMKTANDAMGNTGVLSAGFESTGVESTGMGRLGANRGAPGAVARLKALLTGASGVMGALALTTALSGCFVVVEDPGNPIPSNYRPLIVDQELWVGCSWDSYYQQYRWDFQAFVDDYDGYLDVSNVYVDIIDLYTNPNYAVESWDLAYDGNGWWSNTIYEQYSGYLMCEYYYDYEFDFFAYDHSGASDSVTYIP